MKTVELIKRLCIVTDSFKDATQENVDIIKNKLCIEKGLNPDLYETTVHRTVLCDKVAYQKVYTVLNESDFNSYSKFLEASRNREAIFEFTFNGTEIYDKWDFGKEQPRTLFCQRIGWTFGKEVLSTLNDDDFLTEIHKIEIELMIKYGYNTRAMIFDVREADKKWCCKSYAWKNFESLIRYILRNEFKECGLFE